MYAIVAITKHGTDIARRVGEKLPNADVYYTNKFARGDEKEKGIRLFAGNVRLLLPSLFQTYRGLVLIISLGAVVRMIAPLLKDKKPIRQLSLSMIKDSTSLACFLGILAERTN